MPKIRGYGVDPPPERAAQPNGSIHMERWRAHRVRNQSQIGPKRPVLPDETWQKANIVKIMHRPRNADARSPKPPRYAVADVLDSIY